jgi:hypothetical protein
MLGQNFPISPYYRSEILRAVTINRTGNWWTALLAIRDPKSQKPFLAIYKWQKRGDEWKLHQKVHLNSKEDASKVRSAIDDLISHFDK